MTQCTKMVYLAKVIDGKQLVTAEKWVAYIDNLKLETSKKPLITNDIEAVSILKEYLEQAVKKRMPDKRFGIFFSGGVDSTLIAYLCKKHHADFVCYTVGMEGSKDIVWSAKIANELGFNHKIKVLSLSEAQQIFTRTADILKGLVNTVNIGVGSVILAAIDLARKDNIDTFFTGLGSEEIFAGYQRHEKAENINTECWRGLRDMRNRDFLRDYAIASYENITVLAPFLDNVLIINSMRIDGKLKINGPVKKYILRKTAVALGLKEEFAFRKKIAAQYGSSFDKAIKKISKSYGYRYKGDYLDKLSK
jgi:diphthine-ammonia ligase